MPIKRALLISAAVVALAACDTAEQRAEKHFQSGLELLESGDVDRALVEFRNVFRLDENHKAAWTTYARAVWDRGNVPDAFASFTRVVDIDPNDMEARLALTEISILAQNWDEAERHGAVLLASESNLDGKDVADLALRFRAAALEEDMPAMRELTREAEVLLESDPSNEILIRLLLEGYNRDGRSEDALRVVDTAINFYPDERSFFLAKATLLNLGGDAERLETHFREMIARFPDDDEIKSALLRLLVQGGETDDAEQFLRDEIEIAETEPDKLGRHVSLIAFIRRVNGEEAAIAEIDNSLGLYEDNSLLRALKAGIVFDRGDREEGVSILQTIVDGQTDEDDTAQTNRYKVTLARMLMGVGNEVGARQLVEGVLAADPSQVDALKMSAEWLIEADQADEAIAALRTALDQSPEDADAMTLMARAHQRNGNPELAQDLLSLAVEASNNAPEESMRFAQLLMQQQSFRPAEDVLINALRVQPGNARLLQMLGSVYLQTEDWSRATQVENSLRRLEVENAERLADDLRLQILSRRDGRDQALSFLEQLAGQDGSAAAKIGLIGALLTDGDNAAALALAEEIVTENPDSPGASLVLGNTKLALQDFEGAAEVFQGITENFPSEERAWVQLVRTLSAQGQRDDANRVVDEALTANPGAPNLQWAKATFLEQANDIDGAIEIYEQLYARNSNNLIVANNLASLLATYKTDEASLERAFQVARRLRGTDVAPFQDTYGWITHRRGNSEEALTYLEPAAAALSSDPIVQYHLGTVYLALQRIDDASRAFQRAVDLAEETDERPQIVEAREKIQELAE